jgi:hypothetical protein
MEKAAIYVYNFSPEFLFDSTICTNLVLLPHFE